MKNEGYSLVITDSKGDAVKIYQFEQRGDAERVGLKIMLARAEALGITINGECVYSALTDAEKHSKFYTREFGGLDIVLNSAVPTADEIKTLTQSPVSKSSLMSTEPVSLGELKSAMIASTSSFNQVMCVNQAFLDWLADDLPVMFKRDDVVGHPVNDSNLTVPHPYCGEHLQDVLVCSRQYPSNIDGIECHVRGLVSTSLVSSIFNYYIIEAGLRGVLNENGKIDRRYWHPDESMLKHFGPFLEQLVSKHSLIDSSVSLQRLNLGAVMNLCRDLMSPIPLDDKTRATLVWAIGRETSLVASFLKKQKASK